MKPSREEYESIVYCIVELSEHIRYSDLVLIPIGRCLATLVGSIHFANDLRLEIREALDFDMDEWITGYSYVVYKDQQKQYWYDSQEHQTILPFNPLFHITSTFHRTSSIIVSLHQAFLLAAPTFSF